MFFILFNEFFKSDNINFKNNIYQNILEDEKNNLNNSVNKLINNIEFMNFFYNNKIKKTSILSIIFPFINIINDWNVNVKKIIPCYDIRKYNLNPKIKIILNPYYQKICLLNDKKLDSIIKKNNYRLLKNIYALKYQKNTKK